MFNLLRMDMRQIFKGQLFWVLVGILFAVILASSLMINYISSPEYLELERQVAIEEGYDFEEASIEEMFTLSQVEALGNTLTAGNILTLLVALFAALLITNEFNSGFIKNVFTAGVSKRSYFVSKVIAIFIISFALTAIGVILSLICFAVLGLPFSPSPIEEIALWALSNAALIAILSLLISLIAWLTRSKTITVLVLVFIATGILVQIAATVLSLFPSLSHLTDYTLYSSLSSLQGGLFTEYAFSFAHIVGVAAVSFVIYALLSYIVIKKRDV